jgi:hypothetical protein
VSATGLAQIRYAFFEEHAGAGDAFDLLRRVQSGSSRRNLYNLLRHHDEESISDGDTWLRDDFDYLIAFFSMVEVARLARFVPPRLPPAHMRLTRYVLAHDAVRIYYEDNYPLFLPQAHLLFAQGSGVAPDADVAQEGPRLFGRFFALSQPIETADALETFLWFLDGGERDNTDIDDVLDVLHRRRDFLEYASDRPEDYEDGELSALAKAVQGFVEFLRFIPQFVALLNEAEPFPLLQSAFWHYHGYWVQQLDVHVGTNIRLALDELAAWGDGAARHRSPHSRREVKRIRADYERMLARLSSGRYRWPLIEAIAHERTKLL